LENVSSRQGCPLLSHTQPPPTPPPPPPPINSLQLEYNQFSYQLTLRNYLYLIIKKVFKLYKRSIIKVLGQWIRVKACFFYNCSNPKNRNPSSSELFQVLEIQAPVDIWF